MKTLLLSFSFLFFSLHVIGQTCQQKLELAQDNYKNGKFSNIENSLSSCLQQNLFTHDDKIKAYKLIISAHIFLDNFDKAYEWMEQMLKFDPEWKLDENVETKEFIRVFNDFQTSPVFTFGLGVGVNATLPTMVQNIGIDNTLIDNQSYQPQVSLAVVVKSEYRIIKNFYLGISPSYLLNTFSLQDELFPFTNLTYTETQTIFSLPVSLKFTPYRKNLNPYFGVGGSVDYLYNSIVSADRRYTGDTELKDVSISDINISEMRVPFIYNVNLNFGLKYKLPRGFVFVDLLGKVALNNVNVPSERFNNSELVYRYGYVDNDFTIRSLVFSVGYSRAFFNPKRL